MWKQKKLPIILQSEIAECGLACLAMLLNFHGHFITLTALRKHLPSSLSGITLQQLKKMAETMGLAVTVLRLELAQLSLLRLPCIIHWDMNHFMVLKKIMPKKIIVHDPARGVRLITWPEVNNSFTGIALEIQPNQHFKSFTSVKKSRLQTILQLVKKYHFALLLLIILSCLLQFFYLKSVSIMRYGIDHAALLAQSKISLIFLFSLLGTKLLEVACIAIRAFMLTHVSNQINLTLGYTLMQHLLSLPPAFFARRPPADLVSRFGALDKIKTTITEGAIAGLVDGLMLIVLLSVMYVSNFYLTAVISLFSCAQVIARFYSQQKSRQYHEESLHAKANEFSHFLETLRALPAIKLFAKHVERLTTWLNYFICSLNATTRLAWHKIFAEFAKNLLQGIELTLTLFIGCELIARHMLSLGMLYAFLAYRQQFIFALGGLFDKIQDYYLLKLHLERLADITAEPSEWDEIKKPCLPRFLNSHSVLCLTTASLYYAQEEKPIFHNLQFNLAATECVAIVGPSGCGKTTFLKTLLGLLPPTYGQLYFQRLPVYPKHVGWYRTQIAAVLQEDVLLSGTILQNISFFAAKINYERVVSCAKLAGIWEEIEALPLRFYTLLSDSTSILSSGQKQRILLARALYAQPAILFLDEATSHLDQTKEQQINQAIRSLKIPIVMIAHRQATIQMADRVVALP